MKIKVYNLSTLIILNIIIMFSCFSNIFKAIKTNILGLPDTEKHFNDCDSMYNI